MALLTLGGGYGAVIENGWQGERGENAEGTLRKRPQTRQDQTRRQANDQPTKTFFDLGF